jgi:protein-tyrosine phosphatase
MLSNIYWIDHAVRPRLAIMARPRSGDWLEDEIRHWRRSGIDVVVSLLERDEVEDLDLGREASLCAENGIEFLSFPIRDRGLPADEAAFGCFANDLAKTQKAVAVHCRAGIGRSSLMVATMLIGSGASAEDALAAIAKARGVPVPDTDEQRVWIERIGAR